jgi:VanZ family protein
LKKFLIYHLPLVLYAGLILGVSSISNLKSPQFRFLAADKLAHFVEYSIFAFLTYRSMSQLTARDGGRLPFLVSLLVLAVFAIFDETLQSFIPGRKPDLIDYVSDLAGGILVLGFLWYRAAQKRRSENRKF